MNRENGLYSAPVPLPAPSVFDCKELINSVLSAGRQYSWNDYLPTMGMLTGMILSPGHQISGIETRRVPFRGELVYCSVLGCPEVRKPLQHRDLTIP